MATQHTVEGESMIYIKGAQRLLEFCDSIYHDDRIEIFDENLRKRSAAAK